MAHVFLSYARADSTRARTLKDALHAMKVPVWWDESIQLGDNFPAAIRQKIDQASAVVVLWTATSVKSKWVLYEAERARRRHALIPALLDRVPVPAPFHETDYANLTGWRPGSVDKHFDKLLRDLANLTRLAGAHPAPGNWQVRALTKSKLLVQLDTAHHTVEYQNGRVYVDGNAASGANPIDWDRSFRFTLIDGLANYPAELAVRVSMFRGDVKAMTLTVASRTLYQA